MNSRTIGFIAIIIGVVMLSYSGFHYVTTERVVDLGPIKIDQEKNHSVQWPPIIGIVFLVGGLATLLSKKRTSA